MDLLQRTLYDEDNLSKEDFVATGIFTFAACILIITAGRNAFPEDEKKLSYCISVCSSATMSTFGIFYYLTKIPTQEGYFTLGHLEESRFHGRDNFGCIVCTVFATFLLSDLIFGSVFYPKQCDFLTTWFHHLLYLYFMHFAITGDGYIFSGRPWTVCFLNFLPAEIPTFLLSLGTIAPAFRNDLLFGFTFFLTRIAMHAYLLYYAYLSSTDIAVLGFGVLTMAMHLNWFYSWFTKYGVYYITGKQKPSKKRVD